MKEFTHLKNNGDVQMVDVSNKVVTSRVAIAKGEIVVSADTIELIKADKLKKGNALSTAQISGIMAAKQTSNIIPLCHPLILTGVDVDVSIKDNITIEAMAKVKTQGQTGVEMEALTAVNASLLTIYDMCKAVDKEMTITNIRLISKTGGKSDYERDEIHG